MIHLRRATPDDAAALQELFQTSRAAATWLPEGARLQANFAAESEQETVLVAELTNGDGTTAIVGLLSVFEPERFVHHLYIRADHQRLGIGRALLAELRAFLPFPWRLKCPPANVAAIRFYQAAGWRPIATGDSSWGKYVLLERNG